MIAKTYPSYLGNAEWKLLRNADTTGRIRGQQAHVKRSSNFQRYFLGAVWRQLKADAVGQSTQLKNSLLPSDLPIVNHSVIQVRLHTTIAYRGEKPCN